MEWQLYERVLGRPVLLWIPRHETAVEGCARLRDWLTDLPEVELLVLRDAPVPENGEFAAALGLPATVLHAPSGLLDRLAGPATPALLLVDRHLRVAADCTGALPKLPGRVLDPPAPAMATGTAAPLLVVPRVLLPDECSWLLDYYQRHGGVASGMPAYVAGRQVLQADPHAKIRHDLRITDPSLGEALALRLSRRLLPELERAFCWRAQGYESFKLVCYGEQGSGYFRPHRDNLAPQAAHRRFAVTVNLNSGAYTGGALRFPEFGPAGHTAPAGAAMVFSGALAHEVTDVTAGRRYALLSFLY